MNIVLFRAIFQEIVDDILTEGIILCLKRAEWSLQMVYATIIRDSADSSNCITRKKRKAKESKVTKAKKKEIDFSRKI